MSVMKRWRVEVSYKSDRKTLVKRIEEIAELHDLIEHGPDWREIDQIVVTLDRLGEYPMAMFPRSWPDFAPILRSRRGRSNSLYYVRRA